MVEGGVIATSDARLAFAAVQDLIASGVGIAVLHGEERLARLEVSSDVDLVADRPVGEVLAATQGAWDARGLYPIVLWPYDVGGTGTIFLVDESAGEGVQLDVLHDVHGRGQYGLRSAALLEHTTTGNAFPRLNDEAREIYLARKHQVKHNVVPGPGHDRELAHHILSNESARKLLSGNTKQGPRLSLSRVGRAWSRVTVPVGAWIHIASEDPVTASRAVTILGERMSRILPHVEIAELQPRPVRYWWWIRRVAPVRWRPGVFMSWGDTEERPWGCDIFLEESADLESIAKQVVEQLRSRLPTVREEN